MIRTKARYYIIFPIILAFIYFYRGEIPSIFFYIPLFLVIASFIYGGILCLLIKYTQSIDKKNLIKGEIINLSFSIHNEFFLVYPFIRVVFYGMDYIFGRQTKAIEFALNPFSHKTFDCQWECKYRGDYTVGIDYIEIRDFLGLFSFFCFIREPRGIKVYPRISFLNHFNLNTSFISESDTIVRSNREDMSNISDIRKYSYGDTLRKIHWKATAKRNELMVKNYDNTAQLFVVLFLDLKENYFGEEKNLIIEDQAIECIVAVINYCLRNWIPVKLVYYDEGIKKIEGKNTLDFDIFYDLMRKIRFNQTVSISDVINAYLNNEIEKTNMIVFTINLDYGLYNQIYETACAGYDMTLIYISPEEIGAGNREEENKIIEGLKEVGVKVFKVNISDDIKQILGCSL
ncbi:MAG: DUF58 domain-containing protein [Epulopiscium sp.]|nr:DUF58 domain-containing protein [Candidatus Epulonipiscium sp.]